jgi:hypothetical protein
MELTVVLLSQPERQRYFKTRDYDLEEVREQEEKQEASISRFYLYNLWRAIG